SRDQGRLAWRRRRVVELRSVDGEAQNRRRLRAAFVGAQGKTMSEENADSEGALIEMDSASTMRVCAVREQLARLDAESVALVKSLHAKARDKEGLASQLRVARQDGAWTTALERLLAASTNTAVLADQIWKSGGDRAAA